MSALFVARVFRNPILRPGVALSLALLATDSAAQWNKLNAVLSRSPGESVEGVLISPDGTRALYETLLGDTEDAFGLYSATTDGSGHGAVRLADAEMGRISPDSRWVVYGQGDWSDTVLTSVRIDGTGPRIPLASVNYPEFQITRREPRVVYGAYLDGLRVVPIDGSSSPRLLAEGSPQKLRLSPDDARAVYVDADMLFSVPLDGSSGPVRLDRPFPAGGGVGAFEITSDGTRVVYQSDMGAQPGDQDQLLSVPIDGSAAPIVLDLPPDAQNRDVRTFQLSPDDLWIVFDIENELFTARFDDARPARSVGPVSASTPRYRILPGGEWIMFQYGTPSTGLELYLSPIDVSAPSRKLSAPMAQGGNVTLVDNDAFGKRVVYRADPDGDDEYRLYSVTLPDGQPIALPTPPLGRFGASRVVVAGSQVVFLLGEALYGVPIDGSGAARLLSGSLADFFQLSLFEVPVSPDGEFVLLLAREFLGSPFEAFRFDVDGSVPPSKLNGPLALGEIVGDVARFVVTPDGRRVVYNTNRYQYADEQYVPAELVSVAADGSGPPQRLQPVPGSASDTVLDLQLSPGGDWAIYLGFGSDAYGDYSLLGVPVDGARGPALISGGSYGVDRFALTAQGDRAVYDLDKYSFHELYVRAIDASGPELELCGAIPNRVYYLGITSDGERAVFTSDRLATGVYEIASVPLDASTEPVRISGPLVAGGDAQFFLLSPDGTRAVYLADQLADEVFELFSVPVDGSASPKRLTPGFVAGGDVRHSQGPGGNNQIVVSTSSVAITPDGLRVLYVADQEVDERFELYGVAIDGASAPVRLSGPLVEGGDTSGFEATPDGSRVLYLADQEVDGLSELYSVSTGQGPVVKLSAGAHVDVFRIAPQGTRVVYRARIGAGPFEIFSAAVDGSQPPVKLNSTLVSGGEVDRSFRVSPDGGWVAYVADQRVDGVRELFAVSIEGGRAPEKLNGSLVAGGGVRPDAFEFHPDSRHVSSVADQDVDERFELYLTTIGRPNRRSPEPAGVAGPRVLK